MLAMPFVVRVLLSAGRWCFSGRSWTSLGCLLYLFFRLTFSGLVRLGHCVCFVFFFFSENDKPKTARTAGVLVSRCGWAGMIMVW